MCLKSIERALALALALLTVTVDAVAGEEAAVGPARLDSGAVPGGAPGTVLEPAPLRLPASARWAGEPIEELLRQVGTPPEAPVGTPAETKECCGICGRCAPPGGFIEHERKCPLREKPPEQEVDEWKVWFWVGAIALVGAVVAWFLIPDR